MLNYENNKMSLCLQLILASLAFHSVVAVDPILKVKDTSPPLREGSVVYGIKDQDVTFSCFVENLPVDSEVKFKRSYGKNLREIEQISIDEAVFDNTRFGIEKPTPSTWRLRIRTIPQAYEGIYTCFVTTNIDLEWHKDVKIYVYSPPVLNPAETSTDMTVKQGDTVELECNANGLPTPTIQWERQGKALLPIGQETFISSKMVISNIESHHRGVYKCSAFNDLATVRRDIEVKVLFEPIIKVNRKDLKQAIGYVIELQCLIESNPEPDNSELSWFKGAVGISKTSGRYKLNVIRGAFNRLTYELIINGVEADDFGDYRCQAQNDLGNSYGFITLSETNVPQKSLKLGIVVKASGVIPCSSMLTILTMLLVALYFNRV